VEGIVFGGDLILHPGQNNFASLCFKKGLEGVFFILIAEKKFRKFG